MAEDQDLFQQTDREESAEQAEDVVDTAAGEPSQEEAELPVGEPAEEPAPAASGSAPAVADNGMSWYIIHTYSGFEKKVRESLQTRAEAFGFRDQIGEILIPEEEVAEMRAGKKVVSKRLVYPGYVIVQLLMSDNMRHFIKDTPRVTGFVGGGSDPVPLTADEVNGILYRQTAAADKPRPKLTFEKNETVRIIDGPFSNFTGKVDEVNSERNTLRVLVTIFGRATPVELDFLQVEKI
jgi:transcriptional antiterminator NusG